MPMPRARPLLAEPLAPGRPGRAGIALDAAMAYQGGGQPGGSSRAPVPALRSRGGRAARDGRGPVPIPGSGQGSLPVAPWDGGRTVECGRALRRRDSAVLVVEGALKALTVISAGIESVVAVSNKQGRRAWSARMPARLPLTSGSTSCWTLTRGPKPGRLRSRFRNSRIVELPEKVDDWLVRRGMDVELLPAPFAMHGGLDYEHVFGYNDATIQEGRHGLRRRPLGD